MGAALLDLNDPSKVIRRSMDYLLAPAAPYELCAIYYGAADTVTALAFCHISEVLAFLKTQP